MSFLLLFQKVPLLFLVYLQLLSFVPPQSVLVVDAKLSETEYRWFCDLSLNTVVTLEWNEALQNYVVPPSEDPNRGGGGGGNHTNSDGGSPYYGTPLSEEENGWTLRHRERVLWQHMEAEEQQQQQRSSFLRANGRPDGGDDGILEEFTYSHSEAVIHAESQLLLKVETEQQQQQRHRQLQQPDDKKTRNSNSPVVVLDGPPRAGTASSSSPPPLTVEARSCDCWNSMVWGGDFYCAVPRTHCAIPSSPTGLPECVDVHKDRRIVRSIWPVLLVWYASVLFCLSFTTTGRHAMSCCVGAIQPSWNRNAADRILRGDPSRANQMLLRHYRTMRRDWERRQRMRERRRRQNLGNNTGPEPQPANDPFPSLWDLAIIPRSIVNAGGQPGPTALQLKTRIYKHNDDNDDVGSENDEKEIHSNEGVNKKINDTGTDDRETDKRESLPEDDPVLSLHNVTADTISLDHDAATAGESGDQGGDIAMDDHASLSEWDDHTCTICYAPLEDGDRVGALSCGHAFHVDPCLKHWLSRRNVCPLCLTEDVATPQYGSQRQQNEHGSAMPPVVVGGPPATASPTATAGDEDSSSDVDRSSSRDDSSRNGVAGSNPNEVPAFQHSGTTTNTQQRSATGNNTSDNNSQGIDNSSRGRRIVMTSFLERLRHGNARSRNQNANTNTRTNDREQAGAGE